MLFRQFSSLWGENFAQVDLILEKDEVVIGEFCPGYLVIEGASTELEFQKVVIDYQISLYLDEMEKSNVLERIEFSNAFTVKPSSKQVFPFTIRPSFRSLVSSDEVYHYFVVHITVAGEEDTSERIRINLLPYRKMQRLFSALQELGFHENVQSRYFDGYLQEFRFDATQYLHDEIAELRLLISEEGQQMRLLLETEQYNYLEDKEVKREVLIEQKVSESPVQLKNRLRSILQEMVSHPYAFSRDRYFYYNYHHRKMAQAPGTIGSMLAGKVDVEDWLLRKREREGRKRMQKESQVAIKTKSRFINVAEQEYKELYRDVFVDDFFDEDDD